MKEPKSPAGSSRPENLNKRKRKRIKKVEVPSTGNKTGGNKFNKPKTAKPEISERDIQKEIKDTLARLSNKGGKSKAAKNQSSKERECRSKTSGRNGDGGATRENLEAYRVCYRL